MPRTSNPRRLRAGFLSLLTLCLLMACTPAGPASDPAPTFETSTAPPGETLRTIAGSEIGAVLTVTAALVTVISDQAFVLSDVDLPERGLLVVGTLPDGARPPDLITARGAIAAFEFEQFSRTYGLDQPARYDAWQGRKVLVAHEVRSWA
jgi:hypothetical protein